MLTVKKSVTHIKTYFDILPTDLLSILLLQFNSSELLSILPKLARINDFQKLFSSLQFWKILWKRDISSIVPPPESANEIYIDYLVILRTVTDIMDTIKLLEFLIKGGYDILLYNVLSNEFDYSTTLILAARYNRKEIVKKMIELGQIDLNYALREAVRAKNVDMVKFLLNQGAKKSDAFYIALMQGEKNIIELLYSPTLAQLDIIIFSAATKNNVELMKWALGSLENNVINYDPDRLQLVLQTILNNTLITAVDYSNIEVSDLLLRKGANNYDEALASTENKAIIDLINKYRNEK